MSQQNVRAVSGRRKSANSPRSDVRGSSRNPGKPANGNSLTKHEPRIYFIEAIGIDRMKIGWSANIAQRLVAIRRDELGGTLTGTELRVLGTIPGDAFGEHVLHRHFACAHVTGEWFQANAIRHFVLDIITLTDDQVAAWFDYHRRKLKRPDGLSAKQRKHYAEVDARRARNRKVRAA